MMAAAGFSHDTILRGSAGNHNANNNNDSNTGSRLLDFVIGAVLNNEASTAPEDVAAVEAGEAYYEEVYLDDPNNALVSDSCDENNGQSHDNGTSNGGGGSGEGDGGTFGGNSSSGVTLFTTCEIWHYFDPWGNYSHSVKKNCRTYIFP